MAIPVSGGNNPDSWLTLNGKPLSFQPGQENLAAQAQEFKINKLEITKFAPRSLVIKADKQVLPSKYAGYWEWLPKAFAGIYDIKVYVGNRKRPYVTKVRVLPSNVSFEAYQMMLKDISQMSMDLLFFFNSPSSEKTLPKRDWSKASAFNNYELVKSMMQRLEDIIAQIRRNPHRVLCKVSQPKFLHEVSDFSATEGVVNGPHIKTPATISGRLQNLQLPQTWNIAQNTLTYNVYENQLLKHFLQHQLFSKLQVIRIAAKAEKVRYKQDLTIMQANNWGGQGYKQQDIDKLTEIIDDCERMIRTCLIWSGESFLLSVKPISVVSKPSQVLQKSPHYNRFYQQYLLFQQKLKISLEVDNFVTNVALRKMSDLYEIWAVFQMTHLILDKLLTAHYAFVSSQGFYEVDAHRFQFEVRKNVASIVLAKEDLVIKFRYEPIYEPQSTLVEGLGVYAAKRRTPDLAIEIWQNHKAVKVIIFDPKYKYKQKGQRQICLPQDLNKMREYRDLICWKDSESHNLEYIVSSAYILYPGNVEEHHPQMPKIGAIPFKPNDDENEKNLVSTIIDDILVEAGLA